MISEYINPHQSLGDFYLSACEKPTIELLNPASGEALTEGERSINLTTIVEYAAEFVSSIEVPIKPKFSRQYIENYHIISRTILNRDIPQNEHFNQAVLHVKKMVTLLRGSAEEPYERIGVLLSDYEKSYGKGENPNQDSSEARDLLEIAFSIAWGAYRVSRGKTHRETVDIIEHSMLGAIKGGMISNFKGILGGAISHGLIAKFFDTRETGLIFPNRV